MMWIPSQLAEDEAAHVRVPAARLVAEVDSGLEQFFEACLRHVVLLGFGCVLPRPTRRDPATWLSGRIRSAATGVGFWNRDCRGRGRAARAPRLLGARRLQSGLEVGRERRAEARAARRVQRVGEGEPVGVEELAPEAVAGRAAVGRCRRPAGGRWRRNGRGSGACGRSPGGPRGSSRSASSSSTSKWVRASREAAPDTAIRVALARAAADRRVDRPRARAEPAAGQREVDAARRRALATGSCSAAGASRCGRRPSGRWSPCRAGGRSPAAPGRRRRAGRRARRRGSGRCARAPGGRPARRACRSRRGRRRGGRCGARALAARLGLTLGPLARM